MSVHLAGRILRAVVFDMDGLMLDSERIAQKAWQQASSEAGHDLPDEVFSRVVGRTMSDIRLEIAAIFGRNFPLDVIYQRKQALVEEYLNNEGLPQKPGLIELLERVVRCGLKVAVASSSTCEVIERSLRIAGISAGYFDAMVGGDEVINGKPAPDIFLLAADVLGVAAENCLVLEDSNAGVQAAHAAGMLVLMIPDIVPPSASSRVFAHRVFPSLNEVVDLLGAIPECPN